MPLGAQASGNLGNSLLFIRDGSVGGVSATVQTSPSTLITTGLGANIPRVGKGDGVAQRGLVIERQAQNSTDPRSFAEVAFDCTYGNSTGLSVNNPTYTANYAAPTGVTTPDGNAVACDRIGLASINAPFGRQNGFSQYGYTVWARATSGTDTLSAGPNDRDAINIGLTEEWKRCEFPPPATLGLGSYNLFERAVRPTSPNVSRDLILDLKNCHGGNGANWILETMLGAGVARYTDRPYLNDIATIKDPTTGRIGFEARVTRKSDLLKQPNIETIVYRDINNRAYLSNVDGKITVLVAGVGWTSPVGLTAQARKDVADIWVEFGGGALVSNAKIRLNDGTVTDLGSSGAAQASIVSGGGVVCSLLAANGAGNGVNPLDCWAHRVRAYRDNRRPVWAA